MDKVAKDKAEDGRPLSTAMLLESVEELRRRSSSLPIFCEGAECFEHSTLKVAFDEEYRNSRFCKDNNGNRSSDRACDGEIWSCYAYADIIATTEWSYYAPPESNPRGIVLKLLEQRYCDSDVATTTKLLHTTLKAITAGLLKYFGSKLRRVNYLDVHASWLHENLRHSNSTRVTTIAPLYLVMLEVFDGCPHNSIMEEHVDWI